MDDLEAIKQLFINFDANKDGTISNKELQHFIDSIAGKVVLSELWGTFNPWWCPKWT